MNIKKLSQFLALPLLAIFVQSGVVAQPLFLPGFFVLLLSAESEAFGSISFYDGSEELEFVEIQPGDQLTMSADGTHIRLTDIDDTMADMESFDLTLLIRRGYEA
jgi:hypothetical protein